MKVKINGNEYELKLSMRAYMMMENITGESFNIENLTDTISFFYCVIVTSSKESGFKWDELVDMLDENPQLLREFNTWLLGEWEKENWMSPIDTEDKKKVKEVQ